MNTTAYNGYIFFVFVYISVGGLNEMDDGLEDIADHMKTVGLGILSQAQKNTFFYEFEVKIENCVFGVIQAAHAAELIIKACIAEKDVLLIFSQLPKTVDGQRNTLNYASLFEDGKTIKYSGLPQKLLDTTGYQIKELELFYDFGKLRNGIQHFSVPDVDLSQTTAEFIYKVIAPLVMHFWGLYVIEYCDDEELEYNLLTQLVERGIEFDCPPKWLQHLEEASTPSR